ncbi:proton-translocating transhydrogenase family protein [Escherichia coli]|nr:proton-translocating transhydrogenase family protein [Escherichia coli]EAC1517165.1 hypothetical protein [Escherichia coli]EFA7651539.1 hypothetical protein [Escherichia coli]EFG7878639.1 hypothetical protein [Escherichia coli]EFN4769257.1 hypothetical protein [Escherichia coli]EHK5384625.1 NAD(P) transhydrogenase subunit alpha [Escherichia coli]
MSGGLVTAAYIVAAILFIFSLAGLFGGFTVTQRMLKMFRKN